MALPKQFIFYPNITDIDLENINTKWTTLNIWRLGIQGPPGLEFTLNNVLGANAQYIKIGPIGIYETVFLPEQPLLGKNFKFKQESLKQLLQNNPSSYLIVDIYPYPVIEGEVLNSANLE